jgi:hypothetical protein
MDVAMKNFLEKISNARILVLSIPLALTLGGFFLHFSTGSKGQTLSEIKYGVNLCFTRLTQSVIALQSHDYFSKHLERSYIDFTNECFFEFKEKVAENFSSDEANKLVDQLLEDAQTFSKSLVGVLGKRQNEIGKSTVQSQILPSYSKVDFSRFNLNQWIKKQEGNGAAFTWQTGIFVFILLAINALLFYLIWNTTQYFQKIAKIEEKAADINAENEQQPHRLEVFLAEILDKFNLIKSQEILKRYSESLINQSQILAKMKGIKESTIESSANAAAIALESDGWHNKDISSSNQNINVRTEDISKNISAPPEFKMSSVKENNSREALGAVAAEWTVEDEIQNELADQDSNAVNTQNFTPINEPIADLAKVIEIAAENLTQNGSSTTIVHQTSHAPFWLKGDHEHFEQLFIALVNKIENRFKEFATPSEFCCINIDFDFDSIINQATVQIAAKKAMFHIDDLEYFHDFDHLTMDTHNVIIKEMVKELYSEIQLKNILGESLDDNSLLITLKFPVKEREVEVTAQSPKIVQLIKGKKKDIQKNRAKEITI